jgi:hypothetical protein
MPLVTVGSDGRADVAPWPARRSRMHWLGFLTRFVGAGSSSGGLSSFEGAGLGARELGVEGAFCGAVGGAEVESDGVEDSGESVFVSTNSQSSPLRRQTDEHVLS